MKGFAYNLDGTFILEPVVLPCIKLDYKELPRDAVAVFVFLVFGGCWWVG